MSVHRILADGNCLLSFCGHRLLTRAAYKYYTNIHSNNTTFQSCLLLTSSLGALRFWGAYLPPFTVCGVCKIENKKKTIFLFVKPATTRLLEVMNGSVNDSSCMLFTVFAFWRWRQYRCHIDAKITWLNWQSKSFEVFFFKYFSSYFNFLQFTFQIISTLFHVTYLRLVIWILLLPLKCISIKYCLIDCYNASLFATVANRWNRKISHLHFLKMQHSLLNVNIFNKKKSWNCGY